MYGLPLLFESLDEVAYVRERMDAKLARGLEQAGSVSLGLAGGGFARIFANRPITSTADMRGRWESPAERLNLPIPACRLCFIIVLRSILSCRSRPSRPP